MVYGVWPLVIPLTDNHHNIYIYLIFQFVRYFNNKKKNIFKMLTDRKMMKNVSID